MVDNKTTLVIDRTLKKVDPKMAKVFMPWILKHPKSMYKMMRLAKAYKKSRRIRGEELLKGIKVPPFLILSITSNCNLKCAGCYAAATGTLCSEKTQKTLDIDQWIKIIKEACEMGVFAFIIAGGEPFLMPNLLKISEEFQDRLFLIFTNGTILKNNDIEKLKRLRNTVIVVSIEGNQELTDKRRGLGVYEKIINTINELDNKGIISGISVTINRKNVNFWMDPQNIDKIIFKGIRLAFFLEYIPVKNDTELMLTTEESNKFREMILNYRETKQIFIVHSPGDEEYMGGCVSAGRGFAHITPLGDLTPCPVSNIATHNLTKSSLREGLDSQLFKIIRENENLLETNGSPCALFSHPNEVNELVKRVHAYRTKA
ncbi:MAG: radical SAM/SPASM domain-containing protein [Candidatus Hermodarchaeota archaeon]